MKRHVKLIAVFMAIVMGISLMSALPMSASAVGEPTEYTDEFNGSIGPYWQTKIPGEVTGGIYYTERGTVNRLSGMASDIDYYVEAEVSYSRYFDGYADHTGFVSVAARYDSENDYGYEFGIGGSKESSRAAARLIKRTRSGYSILKLTENVGSIDDFHVIRLVVNGPKISGYVDGNLVAEVYDNTFSSGVPAIVTGDAFGAYKYFTYSTVEPVTGDTSVKKISSASDVVVTEGTALDDIDFGITGILGDGSSRTFSNSEVSISGYTPTRGVYDVTITYGSLKTYTTVFVSEDVNGVFVDRFDSDEDLQSKGWTYGESEKFGYVSGGRYDLHLRNYVESSKDWGDCIVQADVCMDGSMKAADKNKSYGILARGKGGSNFDYDIEFCLITESRGLGARMYLRSVPDIDGYAYNRYDYITGWSLDYDTFYTLRLEVIGNVVKAYIDGTLLYEVYFSDSVNATGYVGLRNYGNESKGYIDNFIAMPIADGTLVGAEPQVIMKGTAPENADINVEIAYSNTLQNAVLPSRTVGAVVSGYDPGVLGVQSANVTYNGVTKPVTVEIVSAADYAVITEFTDAVNSSAVAVEGSSPNRLSESNMTVLRGFAETYSNMPERYRNTLTQALRFRYELITARIEYLYYFDHGYYETMFLDTFESLDRFNVTADNWAVSNNKLSYTADDSTGRSLSYKPSEAIYGSMTFISTLITMKEVSSKAGYLALQTGGKEYLVCVESDSSGNLTLQIYKKSSSVGSYETKASSALTSISLGGAFRMSSVYGGGTITIWINDKKALKWTDSNTSLFGPANSASLYALGGDIDFDNFLVGGLKYYRGAYSNSGYTSETNNISYATGSYFTDDFNDETDGASPDYWISAIEEDDGGVPKGDLIYSEDFSAAQINAESEWSTTKSTTNGALELTKEYMRLSKLSGASAWTDYVVDCDVKIDGSYKMGTKSGVPSIDVRCTSMSNGYECGIVYNKDGSTGTARIYNRATSTTLTSASFKANADTTYHFTVKVEGDTISLYIDNVLMVQTTESSYSAGYIGLRATNLAVFYDNLKVHELEDSEEKAPGGASVKDGSYRLSALNGSTAAWLHVFEVSPRISARVRVDDTDEGSKVGLLARYGVEGSFIRAGYDFDQSKWYIEYAEGQDFSSKFIVDTSTSAFPLNEWHDLALLTTGSNIYLFCDDNLVLSSPMSYRSYGRIGMFTEYATADFDDVKAYMPSGAQVNHGVYEKEIFAAGNQGAVVDLGDDIVLVHAGSSKSAISYDGGLTFFDGSGAYSVSSSIGNSYTSGLKLHNGKYIEIATSYRIIESTDYKTWKWITDTDNAIIPSEDRKDANGNTLPIWHIGSMTEIDLGGGNYRIFMPIAIRIYSGNSVSGHYTRIFYSDDGGVTWCESANNTSSLSNTGSTISETKVIKCSDGSLRLYSTRNESNYAMYAESFDNGVHWSGFYEIDYMPCPKSSFGVAEDPYNPGTYYMAYVKDIASRSSNSLWPRTQIVLTKTTDGKNWEEVMILDRFSSLATKQTAELYQILDPSVTVSENYIYVCFGRSNAYSSSTSHNKQTLRYTRVAKENNVYIATDMTGVSVTADRSSASANDVVTVSVTPEKGHTLDASSLTYSYYDGSEKVTKNIINQPAGTAKGTGLGNRFYFRMPSADVTITAAATSADTNFSIGAIATSYKRDDLGNTTGIRFLSRLYLPTDAAGHFKLNVNHGGEEYTVTSFGSLVIPETVLGENELNMDAVTNPGLRALKSEAYPAGSLYDMSSRYIDYTVVMETAKTGRVYVVRAYVELTSVSTDEKIYVYSDLLKRGLPA